MPENKRTAFQERVYAWLRQVPKGMLTTYGDLANAMNSDPRAIGQALRRNPYAPVVPCHRVVTSDGRIGGFGGETAGKKIREKIALLGQEGIIVKEGAIQDFDRVRYAPYHR